MPDREKVMRALELCSTTKERIASGETIARKACADCPYNHESCEDMTRDALALLKEQEARVMTREEMIAAGKDEEAVFVEECPKGYPVRCFWGIAIPGMEPPKDKPFNYPGGVDFNAVNADGEIWDGDFYGMNAPLGWRAWTARPTEEQRKEVPWEPTEEGENEDNA